jgi:hypothetical protein
MNGKFIVAVVVVFIVWMLDGFIVHAALLKPEYMKLASLFRPESEGMTYFPWMLLGHLIFAVGFVWIYTRGKEAKPFLMQGLRYGFAISMVALMPTYLIYYAIQPMPGNVVALQIVYDTIGCMVTGVVVAWLYREPKKA